LLVLVKGLAAAYSSIKRLKKESASFTSKSVFVLSFFVQLA